MEVRIPFNNSVLPQTQAMGLFSVDKDWLHYDRNIEIDTLLFVIKGEINICEEGIDYQINEGEIFFIKLNLHHWGNVVTPKGSQWFWVGFTPFVDLKEPNNLWLPKHIKVSNPIKLHRRLSSMVELYNSSEKFQREINNSTLYRIFIDLLVQESENKILSHKKVLVDKLIGILKADCVGVFNAYKISKAMNMNYSYLCRIFKSEQGKTINQFYSEIKIQKAIYFLLNSDMTIAQISDNLNFPNPYYFSRVFKKITGLSPRNYQDQVYR